MHSISALVWNHCIKLHLAERSPLNALYCYSPALEFTYPLQILLNFYHLFKKKKTERSYKLRLKKFPDDSDDDKMSRQLFFHIVRCSMSKCKHASYRLGCCFFRQELTASRCYGNIETKCYIVWTQNLCLKYIRYLIAALKVHYIRIAFLNLNSGKT